MNYARRCFPEFIGCSLVKGIDVEGFTTPGLCAGCSAPLSGRRYVWCSDACEESVWGNHRFAYARMVVLREANYRCSVCGKHANEVDHIERANGAHSRTSCIHHRTNLRALCHTCHRFRTAEQRATDASRARRARREAAEQAARMRGEMQPRLAI